MSITQMWQKKSTKDTKKESLSVVLLLYQEEWENEIGSDQFSLFLFCKFTTKVFQGNLYRK